MDWVYVGFSFTAGALGFILLCVISLAAGLGVVAGIRVVCRDIAFQNEMVARRWRYIAKNVEQAWEKHEHVYRIAPIQDAREAVRRAKYKAEGWDGDPWVLKRIPRPWMKPGVSYMLERDMMNDRNIWFADGARMDPQPEPDPRHWN